MESAPWLKHYDPEVPATLAPYPERTLVDYLGDAAKTGPDRDALLFKGSRISYGALERLSDAFGAALVAQGIRKGDRVALLLPNCPQFLIAEFGAWKAGAMVAAINPLYTEHELEDSIKECGVETAVVLTPFYRKLKALQPRTSLRRVIATNIKEHLPLVLRLLFTLVKERKDGHHIRLQPGDLWFADLIRRHAGQPRPAVDIRYDDPALLLFTGGTTGTPKAAVGTHQALVMAGLQCYTWFSSMLSKGGDILMQLIPLFHVYGSCGVQTVALVSGNALALVPNPRDLDDVLHTIHKTQPTFVPGVPTLFIALMDHPAVQKGKVDLTSVKLCISGAAPLLAETKKRWESLTGGRIVEGYALTESMMGAVVTPVKGLYKPGAVGIPLPDVQMKVVDPVSSGAPLPAGQVGELLLKAPQLMIEYWHAPNATRDAIRNGWLYTGDLGYLDEDGYMFIVDRKKDVIKPSGFQVWPREVEEVIASHPAVMEVGVAGVSDAYQGEAVKAWVVLRAGAQATPEEIRDFCRGKLTGYKVPKYVEFRDSLPKSSVGKVLRRFLKEETPARPGEPVARQNDA